MRFRPDRRPPLAALLAAVALAAPARAATELGRGPGVIVVRLAPGDTAASLAESYLHDPREAWRVSALDGAATLAPGALAAIARPGHDDELPAARTARYVPVLCYHRFAAGRSTSAMEVSAASLEAQLRWLGDNGYTVVPLSALGPFLKGEAALPRRAVAITIDDGYASAYAVAYPLLKRYGAPFTLFAPTRFIGAGAGLSWRQIEEMRRSGLASVQSHSETHPDLTQRRAGETPALFAHRLRGEIDGSRRTLAARLGEAPDVFAYPYGAATAETAAQVRGAGYALAFTVARGGDAAWTPPLLLHRDMIYGGDTLEVFARRLAAAERGERIDTPEDAGEGDDAG